ncbi:MAG: formylmethanofuran dehydrogenase subunit C, partial [Gammaproteobacteria bacterium]
MKLEEDWNAMKLSLHTQPEVPLEAEVISPAHLAGLSEAEIGKLTLYHGNRKVELGEFFSVSGSGPEQLEVEGELSAVKLLGSDMTAGSMVIQG